MSISPEWDIKRCSILAKQHLQAIHLEGLRDFSTVDAFSFLTDLGGVSNLEEPTEFELSLKLTPTTTPKTTSRLRPDATESAKGST